MEMQIKSKIMRNGLNLELMVLPQDSITHHRHRSNWISWRNEQEKRQLKLAAAHSGTNTSSLVKPKWRRKKEKKVDHPIWIKHKWTWAPTEWWKNEKRIKVNHLRLGTSARLHQPQRTAVAASNQPTANIVHDCFSLLWRFCLDLAINTMCKQFGFRVQITWWLHESAAPQCPTQISIFNWLILMHTRRIANEQKSRKKNSNWKRGIRWPMEHAAAKQRAFRIVNIDVWIEYLWECECGRPRDLNITSFFPFPCSISSVSLITKYGTEFKPFCFFFLVRLPLWALCFSRGPLNFHLHWSNDEKQSKWKFHCSFHSDGMHRAAQRTRKLSRPEPPSWDNYALFSPLDFFRCGECSFNKLTLFFFDGISAGFFVVGANSMIFFLAKKTNAQNTWVKRSSIISLLFIFSPNESRLWGGDRHFVQKKASCCLITLCKLAFQIM